MSYYSSRAHYLVLLVLCFSVSAAVASAEDKEVLIGPKDSNLDAVRYGEVKIEGQVEEIRPPLYVVRPDFHTVYSLLDRFQRARTDRDIDGVIVRVGRLDCGWAKVEEIRSAIKRIKAADKEVICFLEAGGNLEYYLASAADRIVMRPSASLMLLGLRAEVVFFKNLLDEVGVKGDIIQVGKYKGADESLTRETASDYFAEAINGILDALYGQLGDAIAEGRDGDRDEVKSWIDGGPYSASQAEDSGLIDDLAFHDELLRSIQKREGGPFKLVRRYGEEKHQEHPLGSGMKQLMGRLLGMGSSPDGDGFPEGPTIAVLYAVGPIYRGDPDRAPIGEHEINAGRIIQHIQALRERDNVEAIVLRVESPGGSAEASDMIWRELERTDERKPVIVSLSDVAASGGYYIATGGRHILADSGTMTGSIGVVGGKIVIDGLMDKLGITVDVFERGDNAGIYSSVDEMSSSQREKMRKLLEETYRIFVERVVEARDRSREELEPWIQGRPLTGEQALEGELVDEIGDLHDAINKARSEAGIDKDASVSIVRVPKPEGLLKVMLSGRDPGVEVPSIVDASARELPRRAESIFGYMRLGQRMLENGEAAALMPMWLSVE
ncbi:MAG: signal peptide peptidase SppA [Planctomycetota bacterium]